MSLCQGNHLIDKDDAEIISIIKNIIESSLVFVHEPHNPGPSWI